jgi:DNA polymerase-3 subunit delta'
MSFHTIIGQERAKRLLQNALRQSKVAHAYIFAGPSGTGRKRMAQTFVQALFCPNSPDDACGTCIECRKVKHGNHPDLFWIEPDGSSIKIDQIRELQQQFSYRSTASGTKVYVLNEADRMTVQAANSLLKFLEEPQSPAVAILITENGQALLPTIQSRAQWVSFTPMAPDHMRQVLVGEGFPEELVRCAVQMTSGLDAARDLIRLNWFAETRNVMIQLMKDALALLPVAGTIQQKVIKTEVADHMDMLFDMMVLWLKDMIHVIYGRKHRIVFIDQMDWIAKHAFSREAGFWVKGMEHAVEARKRIRIHANPQLVLEQVLFALQQAPVRQAF